MKLWHDQIAFHPNSKLILPTKCCCCLKELSNLKEETKKYDLSYQTIWGTPIKTHTFRLPICKECKAHDFSLEKSFGIKFLLYMLLFLITWGIQSLFKILPEILCGIFFALMVSSEIYWGLKRFTWKKQMLKAGHAGIKDFANLKIKSANFVIITFKNEEFAKIIRDLNKENEGVYNNIEIRH